MFGTFVSTVASLPGTIDPFSLLAPPAVTFSPFRIDIGGFVLSSLEQWELSVLLSDVYPPSATGAKFALPFGLTFGLLGAFLWG